MDEDKDGRVWRVGAEDVELLDRGFAVGAAERLADPRAGAGAVARPALVELEDIGLVNGLIVGRVELDLIVVEKDARAFLMRRRPAIGLDARRRQDDRRRVLPAPAA